MNFLQNLLGFYGTVANPVYAPTAAYGHFGREPYLDMVKVWYDEDENGNVVLTGNERCKRVCFFAWEKLDHVDKLKELFGV